MTQQERKIKVEFPKVPDFLDEDYKEGDPKSFFEASQQRMRETLVSWKGLHYLQQKLEECFVREGVNYLKKCRPLALEYLRKLECPDYICPEESGGFGIKKYTFFDKYDDYQDRRQSYGEPFYAEPYKLFKKDKN